MRNQKQNKNNFQKSLDSLKLSLIPILETRIRYYIDQRLGLLINNNSILTRGSSSFNITEDGAYVGKSFMFVSNGNTVAKITSDGVLYVRNIWMNGLNVLNILQTILGDINNNNSIFVKHSELKDGTYIMDISDLTAKQVLINSDKSNTPLTVETTDDFESTNISFDDNFILSHDKANNTLNIGSSLIVSNDDTSNTVDIFTGADAVFKVGNRSANNRCFQIYFDNMANTDDCYTSMGNQGHPAIKFRTTTIEHIMDTLLDGTLTQFNANSNTNTYSIGYNANNNAQLVYNNNDHKIDFRLLNNGNQYIPLTVSTNNTYINTPLTVSNALTSGYHQQAQIMGIYNVSADDDTKTYITFGKDNEEYDEVRFSFLYHESDKQDNRLQIGFSSNRELVEINGSDEVYINGQLNVSNTLFCSTIVCDNSIIVDGEYVLTWADVATDGAPYTNSIAYINNSDVLNISNNLTFNDNNNSLALTYNGVDDELYINNTLIDYANLCYKNINNNFSTQQTINTTSNEALQVVGSNFKYIIIGKNTTDANRAAFGYRHSTDGNSDGNNYGFLYQNGVYVAKFYKTHFDITQPLNVETSTNDRALTVFNSSLTQGNYIRLSIGKSTTIGECANVRYLFDATNSNSNCLILGHDGIIQSVQIYPNAINMNSPLTVQKASNSDILRLANTAANGNCNLYLGNSTTDNDTRACFAWRGNSTAANRYAVCWVRGVDVQCWYANKTVLNTVLNLNVVQNANNLYVLSSLDSTQGSGNYRGFRLGHDGSTTNAMELLYYYNTTENSKQIKLGFYGSSDNAMRMYPNQTTFNRCMNITDTQSSVLSIANTTANSSCYLWLGNSTSGTDTRGTLAYEGNSTADSRFMSMWCRGTRIQRWYKTYTQIDSPTYIYGQLTVQKDVEVIAQFKTGAALGNSNSRKILVSDNNYSACVGLATDANGVYAAYFKILNQTAQITVKTNAIYLEAPTTITNMLAVSPPSSYSWYMLGAFLASSLTATHRACLRLGRSTGNGNCVNLHFYYAGDNDNNNYFGIDFDAVGTYYKFYRNKATFDQPLTISGSDDGMLGVYNPTSNSRATIYIGNSDSNNVNRGSINYVGSSTIANKRIELKVYSNDVAQLWNPDSSTIYNKFLNYNDHTISDYSFQSGVLAYSISSGYWMGQKIGYGSTLADTTSLAFGYNLYYYHSTDTSRQYRVGLYGGQEIRFYKNKIESTTSISNVSDRRLKTNINELDEEESTKIIDNVKTYSFNFKSDSEHTRHFGVIAQELQDIAPDLVSESYGKSTATNNDDNDEFDESDPLLCVNYVEMIPHLIKYCQQLNKRISELEKLLNV